MSFFAAAPPELALRGAGTLVIIAGGVCATSSGDGPDPPSSGSCERTLAAGTSIVVGAAVLDATVPAFESVRADRGAAIQFASVVTLGRERLGAGVRGGF